MPDKLGPEMRRMLGAAGYSEAEINMIQFRQQRAAKQLEQEPNPANMAGAQSLQRKFTDDDLVPLNQV